MIKDALVYISSPQSVQVISVTWPSATLDATQTLHINSLPPILNLHLKRFLYDASDTTTSSTSLEWYVQHTCFTHYVLMSIVTSRRTATTRKQLEKAERLITTPLRRGRHRMPTTDIPSPRPPSVSCRSLRTRPMPVDASSPTPRRSSDTGTTSGLSHCRCQGGVYSPRCRGWRSACPPPPRPLPLRVPPPCPPIAAHPSTPSTSPPSPIAPDLTKH